MSNISYPRHLLCGACGHNHFSMKLDGKRILVECKDCCSVSEIRVFPASLKIDWPTDIPSQGIISPFEETPHE